MSASNSWQIFYTAQSKKDAKKVTPSCKKKLLELLDLISDNPFKIPPAYEALIGNLKGAYSRRINIQHRLLYQVDKQERTIKILRVWSHYD